MKSNSIAWVSMFEYCLILTHIHSLNFRYNSYMKEREKKVLLQGVPLPNPKPTAAEPLPRPRLLLPKPTIYKRPEHGYVQPPNTAGKAKQRKRRAPAATATAHAKLHSATPSVSSGKTPAKQAAYLPRSTAFRLKKQEEWGLAPVNIRRKGLNSCRQCHQPHTKDTGHSCVK